MFARFFPHGYRKSTPDAVTLSDTLAPSVTLVLCGCELMTGVATLRGQGACYHFGRCFQCETHRQGREEVILTAVTSTVHNQLPRLSTYHGCLKWTRSTCP